MTDIVRLCAVQAAPAYFDKAASLDIALGWIERAARRSGRGLLRDEEG